VDRLGGLALEDPDLLALLSDIASIAKGDQLARIIMRGMIRNRAVIFFTIQ